MPWQAIGPDPANEKEDDLWQRPRGEHEAEVGLRSREIEDGERERDRRDAVAEEGDKPSEEQQPKLPLAKWPEPAQSGSGQGVEPSQPYQPTGSISALILARSRLWNWRRV
jgi:hypothetical protein